MASGIDRKQLKSPDKFQQIFAEVYKGVYKQRKLYGFAGIAVLVLVIVTYTFSSVSEKRYQERFSKLYAADSVYRDTLKKTATTRREHEEESRAKFLKDQPVLSDDAEASVKNAAEAKKKEFEEALTVELDKVKVDHSATKKSFQDVIDMYPDSDVAILATLRLVRILNTEKQFSETLTKLRHIRAAAIGKGMIEIAVRANIANVLESSKEYAEAQKAYAQLTFLGKTKNPHFLHHKYQSGRLLGLLGKKDEAKVIYDEIIDQYPASEEAKFVKKLALF